MPDSSRNDDDLERQLAETEQARQEAEERWTAGLANFATQLEEAFERGRDRGWAECARRYGLPLTAPAGRHRQHRRHLSAVPGVGGVAAFAALRLAGTARTVTSAGAAFARHTAAHSTAAAVTVAAGVTVVAGGVTVALAPSTIHLAGSPPPAAAAMPLTPASAVRSPAALWPSRQAPAGAAVNSASPAPSASALAPPVVTAVPVPDVPIAPVIPSVPAVPDIPPVQISTPVSAVAEAAAPVVRHARRTVHGLGQAVGGLTGPRDGGRHRHGGWPVTVPSVLPSVIPVPSVPVSLPPVLGGG